ncbi:MAG: mevalonate kinase [Anaerolineae bacterium]|jgi:mevalonate kinase|nr:mevalonate kinase [Anaerolineae bacterium]
MEIAVASAPGKVILFGEHAVVYGRPALAAPVAQVCASAVVEAGEPGSGLILDAMDLRERVTLACAGHPLAEIARLALAELGMSEPDWRVGISSTIPIASGMGSGAAVSAALARAIATAAGRPFSAETVSALVYEVERLHHGTPSGVDNTVIAYGQPVYFKRGEAPQPFAIGAPLMLAIGDTGIASPTKVAVGDVRAGWQRETARYEALFDAVAEIVESARQAIAAGRVGELGPLMNQNHGLLREMGVSSPELDRLVEAARAAGAGGAKLSGGGRGGNMIALVTRETAATVANALSAAGARRVIVTDIG